MELKAYQSRVLDEARSYLRALAGKVAAGSEFPAFAAWKGLYRDRRYHERETGARRELPTFCIHVPTGGGKSLLGALILAEAYRALLPERNGAGLALWIVPSDQIYRDTIARLKDRRDFHRESLEFALGRRVDVWEKHELCRLSPVQLAHALNIVVVKLQGTNRKDKESLKFFRDAGGNIVRHFPPEDDSEAQRALLNGCPNLDMIEADETTGRFLAMTSLANLVRLCEPVVILDEGHRATSDLARKTIEEMNPRLVVELSATPPEHANILSRVTGRELLAEEMIKLPINVASSCQISWRDLLASAADRRKALAAKAAGLVREGGRSIRPIALVQVERTGADQRDGRLIHAEDVREHLVQKLGVDARAVAVKSSARDDIEGMDLMDDACPVEWVITKAALQEGWDCPFAYVLVSLAESGSKRGLTQLVGRVLRQPFARRTPVNELNESYVYCLRLRATDIIRQVRDALEAEGYTGEGLSVVDQSPDANGPPPRPIARIRSEHLSYYRKPFEGKIFLPRFCVKQGIDIEPLDYFRHLLAHVDVEAFDYASIEWDLRPELAAARERFLRIDLDGHPVDRREADADAPEDDAGAARWIASNLGTEWFGAKSSRVLVDRARARLPAVAGRLALVKFAVRDRVRAFLDRETDRATQLAFRRLHGEDKLLFYLECAEGRFEIPREVTLRETKRMRREDDNDLQRTLFDMLPDDLNAYERSVALYLDDHPQVLWWYRNLVGAQHFSIQGYRRGKIYPDFVVQEGDGKKKRSPVPVVLVIESKGKHLAGNADTEYKRDVAKVFEEVGRAVPWQKLGKDFADHTFRFQVLDEGSYPDRSWRNQLQAALTAAGKRY